MCHVITDGKNYLANHNGWTLVTDKNRAQRFTKEKADNMIKSLPKILLNKSLYVEELKEKEITSSDSVFDEISCMDGAYMDFDLNEVCNDNKYMYHGETIIEKENIDFVDFLKTAIQVFSQLDDYVENMGFLERESDLKLMDVRHYKRDLGTRLNGIEAQQLQYYEQEIERERIKYKINKSIAALLQKDIKRIKDSNYISIVNRMATGEYRYRRLTKDNIEEIMHTKRGTKLKAV